MSKDFLGRGLKFPVQVNQITGKVLMSEYEQDIKDSIQIILSTAKGERIMHPDFGCDIYNYIFASINIATISSIEKSTRDALTAWEPRIKVTDVKAASAEADNRINITIEYIVSKTNNRYNMVYPFYLKEG